MGSTECDLGGLSEFVTHRRSRRGYFGADYDTEETNRVHSNGHHKYKVSRTVIASDVFINIPKMKTHKKAGITCSLKNLVGINTYKNWLPHHSEGTPDEGGDQFPRPGIRNRAETVLLEKFRSVLWKYQRYGRWMKGVKGVGRVVFGDTREVVRSGNWYGNDTIWRMILDLNKVLLYATPEGVLGSEAKKYISVVDGIVAGEGNGPEAPDAKRTGVLLAGTNAVAVDALCSRLMGFDWRKIPLVRNAFDIKHLPICDFRYEDISVESTRAEFGGRLADLPDAATFRFRPHFGWVNHIEMEGTTPRSLDSRPNEALLTDE
jgi:hypothetical protein